MKKRILSLLLALALLCAMLPQITFPARAEVAYSGTCGENLTWSFDPDTGTLTIAGSGGMYDYYSSTQPWKAYTQAITKVTFPDGLTSIGNYAFRNCSALTAVTLPDGLTSIGSFAFCYCKGLTAVTFPDALTSIGYGAFEDCTGLIEIALPDALTSIGPSAFERCQGLTEITLPDGLTSIGDRAFWCCTGLTSITLPDALTSIGNYAFSICTGLTSITLPDALTSIGSGAFSYCTGLTAFYVSEENPCFSVGSFGTLFNKDQSILIQYPCGRSGSYAVPNSVSSIGDNAFYCCKGLTAVTFPDGLTSISSYAFHGCNGLTSLTLPDGLTSIGSNAFSGCTRLTSITLPDGLTTIGDYAFHNCYKLTSITLPDGLTSIGDRAFWCCTGLTSIILPDGLSSIGDYVFSGCKKLTSISFPDGLTSIGSGAFENCTGLTEITLPNGLISIGSGVFYGCTGLTSVTLPDGLTSIGYEAFRGCTGLTSITLPDGLTSIGDFAFSGCKGLTEITLPDGLTSIGSYEFQGCTGLTSVTLPDGLTSIGSYAFYFCSYLTEIVLPASLGSVGSNAFDGCNRLTDLYYGGTEAQWTQLNVSVPALCRIHCSTADPTNHWTVSEYVAPTCTEPGSQSKTCACGYEVLGEEIPALGHDYQGAVTSPTCVEQGYTTYTCSRCGDHYVDSYTDALGHNIVNGVCTVCGLILVSEPVVTSHPEAQTVGLGKYASFTVEASGEYLSYQWQYQRAGQETWNDWAGKTSATLRFKGTSTNNGYRYRCVVTNAAGSVTSEAATLTVISKPVITTQPEDFTVVLGAYATFTVEAAGENLSYQWQYQRAGQETWKNWAGKTSATLRFKGTSTNNAYKYRCVVSNEGGSTTSEAASLTVISKPVITTQPENTTVAQGSYATFLVEAAGDGLSYQWQFKRAGQETWNDWAGKTSATLTFRGTSTNNKYQYRCVVTNAAGSVTSDAAILTVIIVAAPTITSHPESVIILSGDTATFRVVASGENLEYQWQSKPFGSSSWIDLSGKTSSSLEVTGTSANDGCQYRCVVSNDFGAVNSNAATLTVVASSNSVKPEWE